MRKRSQQESDTQWTVQRHISHVRNCLSICLLLGGLPRQTIRCLLWNNTALSSVDPSQSFLGKGSEPDCPSDEEYPGPARSQFDSIGLAYRHWQTRIKMHYCSIHTTIQYPQTHITCRNFGRDIYLYWCPIHTCPASPVPLGSTTLWVATPATRWCRLSYLFICLLRNTWINSHANILNTRLITDSLGFLSQSSLCSRHNFFRYGWLCA